MNKLLGLSLFLFFSMGVFAQESIYSDEKLNIQMTVESLKDQKNDNFFEYYSLEIKNISDEKISFTPVFNYKTTTGELRNSTSHDGVHLITLAPGETLKGNLEEYKELTLFKEFLIGNSGKKSSTVFYTLESISINY